MRELVLQLRSGLCNRLFSISAALEMAEQARRRLRVDWLVTGQCGAVFEELFVVTGNFDIVDELVGRTDFDFSGMGWSVAEGEYSETFRSAMSGTKESVSLACDVIGAGSQSMYYQFCPVQELSDRVYPADGRAIGVHARFGEFKSGFVSLPRLLEEAVKHDLGGTIFLSTDDGSSELSGREIPDRGVIRAFRETFGNRLVVGCRTLGRGPEAIRDAVVDLWTLRACSFVIGNYKSTFSRFAVSGREGVLLKP